MGVRDFKDSAGPVLRIDRGAWQTFVADLRRGHFRHLWPRTRQGEAPRAEPGARGSKRSCARRTRVSNGRLPLAKRPKNSNARL
jgi:Domain of unknown function (DUF397)